VGARGRALRAGDDPRSTPTSTLPCDNEGIDVARYREDGYLAPLRAFDETDALVLRSVVEDWLASEPDPAVLRTKAHLRCAALLEVVRSPAVLDRVGELLGPDVLCRSSSIFLKEPGASSFVAWHQDARYWELDPPDVATAWIALGPSTVENGALRVLPGSHRAPLMRHGTIDADGNMLSRGQGIVDPVDETTAVTLTLLPGEMSIHDVRLAHASAPNVSSERRIGYAIRYVAAHVRSHRTPRDSALLVRGRDRFCNFDPESA
jgi:ectoine hydroxylase-related dioxygenase (phytanoyl-CoA dioxygenase family)